LRARRNSARTTPTSAGQPNSAVRNTNNQKLRPRIANRMMTAERTHPLGHGRKPESFGRRAGDARSVVT
jgi:hypothetical protein